MVQEKQSLPLASALAGREKYDERFFKAVREKNVKSAEVLIELGADVNAVLSRQRALSIAVQQQDAPMIEMLLAHRARPSANTLNIALQQKDAPMVNTLLANHAIADDESINLAIKWRDQPVIKNLMAHGACPREQHTKMLQSAIDSARLHQHYLVCGLINAERLKSNTNEAIKSIKVFHNIRFGLLSDDLRRKLGATKEEDVRAGVLKHEDDINELCAIARLLNYEPQIEPFGDNTYQDKRIVPLANQRLKEFLAGYTPRWPVASMLSNDHKPALHGYKKELSVSNAFAAYYQTYSNSKHCLGRVRTIIEDKGLESLSVEKFLERVSSRGTAIYFDNKEIHCGGGTADAFIKFLSDLRSKHSGIDAEPAGRSLR